MIKKYTKRLVTVILVFYALICGYFYFFQESLLFHPELTRAEPSLAIQKYQITWEHEGIQHRGWFVRGSRPKPLMVYFGGNAESVALALERWLPFQQQYDLLTVEYRGFGASEGAPTEVDLCQDAIALLKEWMQRYGYQAKQMVLVGRSLGSGVAIQAATQLEDAPKALILLTPYDSINAVASYMYPYIPISWINRHPFYSDRHVQKLETRSMIVLSGLDEVVPMQHGQRLADVMRVAPEVVILPEADHGNIYHDPLFFPAIAAFLKGLAA